MNRLKRYWLLLKIFLIAPSKRAKYLKKRNYFKAIGDYVYLQPWNFGTEPHMISIGNNVHVASGVKFINHDISIFMLQHMEPETKFRVRAGEIAIGDNVFIGSNSILLYDTRIGNNVVIGAGSVVTKDIPDGVVAAGVPCRPIGTFDDWKEKMKE